MVVLVGVRLREWMQDMQGQDKRNKLWQVDQEQQLQNRGQNKSLI